MVWDEQKGLKRMRHNLEVMRVRKSITLPEELVEWLNRKIEERRFYNLSHAVEEAVRLLKEKEEQ